MIAILSVIDTGFGYTLGYHSLTKSKLQLELNNSKLNWLRKEDKRTQYQSSSRANS